MSFTEDIPASALLHIVTNILIVVVMTYKQQARMACQPCGV